MVMDIKFQELSITLLPSGALYIHDNETLVLADLHLGKGVLLQDSGVPLVHQIDEKTIGKLESDLRVYSPKQCIICGDLVHAKSRNIPNQLRWFSSRMSVFNCRFILTVGNHDVNEYEAYIPDVDLYDSFQFDGIQFIHEPPTSGVYISGHVHPGVKIKKGRLINHYKAFAVSDNGIICPSFGETAGLYSKLFDGFNYYFIKHQELHTFIRDKL